MTSSKTLRSFIVAVVLLSSTLAWGHSSQECRHRYPSPPSNNHTSAIPPKVVSNVFDLLNGLAAQKYIVIANALPNRSELSAETNTKLRSLMRYLSALGAYEQRLKSFLTLAEVQNDPDLLAMQAVFEVLIADTCKLYTAVYNKPCSRDVLKGLRLKLESRETVSNALELAQELLGTKNTIGQNHWLLHKLACSLSPEEIAQISPIRNGPNSHIPLNKGCCSEC